MKNLNNQNKLVILINKYLSKKYNEFLILTNDLKLKLIDYIFKIKNLLITLFIKQIIKTILTLILTSLFGPIFFSNDIIEGFKIIFSWLTDNYIKIYKQISIIIQNAIGSLVRSITNLDVPTLDRKPLEIKTPNIDVSPTFPSDGPDGSPEGPKGAVGDRSSLGDKAPLGQKGTEVGLQSIDGPSEEELLRLKWERRLEELSKRSEAYPSAPRSLERDYSTGWIYVIGGIIIIIAADMIYYNSDNIYNWISPILSDSYNSLRDWFFNTNIPPSDPSNDLTSAEPGNDVPVPSSEATTAAPSEGPLGLDLASASDPNLTPRAKPKNI